MTLQSSLSMNAGESVTLDDETMPFSQFREEYLSKANRIYVDKETEFMDMFASADVPNTLEKLAKESSFLETNYSTTKNFSS